MTATKKTARTAKAKSAPATGDTLERLTTFNVPQKHLVMLDYIEARMAGDARPFADFAAVAEAQWRRDPLERPAALLADYKGKFDLDEDEETQLLIAYLDRVAASPKAAPPFGEFLAECFADPTTMAYAEPQPEPQPAPPMPQPEQPAPQPEQPEPEPTPSSLAGRRVFYKADDGRTIRAVCVRDADGVLDLVDDARRAITGVDPLRVTPDDGPVTWGLSRERADEAIALLKHRGPVPEKADRENLFFLARRVTPDHRCIVAIVNSAGGPYVDAYVYDDAAPDGAVAFVSDVADPPKGLFGAYVFQVPGLGDVPAQVVVKD
jgi:hypothetical protein